MIFKDLFKKRDEDGAAVYESENHPTDFTFEFILNGIKKWTSALCRINQFVSL